MSGLFDQHMALGGPDVMFRGVPVDVIAPACFERLSAAGPVTPALVADIVGRMVDVGAPLPGKCFKAVLPDGLVIRMERALIGGWMLFLPEELGKAT